MAFGNDEDSSNGAAAGIGGDKNGANCGTVTIRGGKGEGGGGFAFYGGTVTAWRSNGNGEASTAVAIGHGDGSTDNGTLALDSDVIVSAGADEGSATAVDNPSTWQCSEKWVRMVTTYPLWVGGVQVTSANASNITGSETPTASYDAAKKTLTLNGYTNEDWYNWGGDKRSRSAPRRT